MPKLDDAVAGEVEEAESMDFTPLKPGIYACKLLEVEVKEGQKAPYWNWKYEVLEGQPNEGRFLWNVTSLSPKAAFKLKETFEAFGVPANTDTDELCGCVVNLQVDQRTIQSGAKAGQTGNQVAQVLPFDGEVDGQEEDPFD
jgi:hypothetical protein